MENLVSCAAEAPAVIQLTIQWTRAGVFIPGKVEWKGMGVHKIIF